MCNEKPNFFTSFSGIENKLKKKISQTISVHFIIDTHYTFCLYKFLHFFSRWSWCIVCRSEHRKFRSVMIMMMVVVLLLLLDLFKACFTKTKTMASFGKRWEKKVWHIFIWWLDLNMLFVVCVFYFRL